MAATWIKPIHTNKGKSIAQSIEYVGNPDKTNGGELVSSYQCNIRIVDAEFRLSKEQYANQARYSNIDRDILAYHIRQWLYLHRRARNRIKPNYLTSAFPEFLEKNGFKRMRFHDLRHSCASLLLANGVPLKEIQEWLGHSDFAITANIYAHLEFDSKIKSAGKMTWIHDTSLAEAQNI